MQSVVNGRPDITVLPCLLGFLATEGTGICVKLYCIVNKHVKISEINLKSRTAWVKFLFNCNEISEGNRI